MKKLSVLSAAATLLLSLTSIYSSARHVLSDKDDDNVQAIKQNTMVVVLLEEDKDYTAKLVKKGKQDEIATYQNSIKTYNENIKAVVSKYFYSAKDYAFKTMSEVADMPVEQREKSTFLVYDRSMSATHDPAIISYDFFSDKPKKLEKMVNTYLDMIHFECVDPTYKDDKQYRLLTIFVKNPKNSDGAGILIQNLPSVVPSKGDLAYTLTAMQDKFNDMANHVKYSMKEARQQTKGLMATIIRRTLLINKADLDNKINEPGVKANYPYKFKIVSKDDFDKAIMDKDTSYCCLMVVPLAFMPGPLVASVKYWQLIVDPKNSKTLMTNSAQVFIGPFNGGGYNCITADHFKHIAEEIDKYK